MNSDDVNDHIDSNNDTSNSTNINSIIIIILSHINIISLIIFCNHYGSIMMTILN